MEITGRTYVSQNYIITISKTVYCTIARNTGDYGYRTVGVNLTKEQLQDWERQAQEYAFKGVRTYILED